MLRVRTACIALSAISCTASHGAPRGDQAVETTPARQSFELQIPQQPAVVPVGRERQLAYELHLTNFARSALTLTGVEVVDDRTGAVLGRLHGPSLEGALYVQGAAAGASSARNIEAGRRAIVYFNMLIAGRTPAALRHRVTFEAPEVAGPASAVTTGGRAAVDARPLPILGPPLRGGPWVAVYDPNLERGHRRVVYAVGGTATIPGRHAIDWMRPAPIGGQGASDDANRGAGAEVLAVADGVVASTRDGVSEPTPGSERPRVALRDATGNFISVSVGAGRYAFYEHLMPGLLVKPGDRVRRGQVIGRLGSTGQASRPHLHFHLANANSPLAAEGLPYILTGGQIIGTYRSIAAFEAGESWTAARAPGGVAMLPPPNAVFAFPEAQVRRP